MVRGRGGSTRKPVTRAPSTPRGRRALDRRAAPAARQQDARVIRTALAPAPVGAYPHARRLGNLLFLSGVGPRQPGTGDIPGVTRDAVGRIVAHDIRVQTRAAIENVGRILEAAGSSLARVVDVTVFLTDMAADFAAYNQVWAEHFGSIQPARTTVEVGSLPTPIAVELKVVAEA